MDHDIFDLRHWEQKLKPEKFTGICGQYITSPYHLLSVEFLRNKVLPKIKIRKKVPTEIFLYSKGEPSKPYLTKIGGVPFWSAGDIWPRDKKKRRMIFLAQICFIDFQPFQDLPGNVLLLFCNAGDLFETHVYSDDFEVSLIWKNIKEKHSPVVPSMPDDPFGIEPLFGLIHNSYDYPGLEAAFRAYDEPYWINCWAGTKIGGVPVFAQIKKQMRSKRFLCSFGTIRPRLDTPYPYVNVRPQIELLSDWHKLIWGDMGTLNVFIDDKGKLSWDIQGG